MKNLLKRWFIDGMSYMALGLFCSLIIGLILETLGTELKPFFDTSLLIEIGKLAKSCTGAAVGVAVTYGLGAKPMVIFSSAVTGMYGYELGGAAGTYIVSLVTSEAGRFYSGKTKIDIILTPLLTLLIGGSVAKLIGPLIQQLMLSLGEFISFATGQQPLLMGILVSLVFGLTLSSPVSSAALALMLNINGTAAAAATIGCCCHMIGFAVTAYRDNGIQSLVAHGIGTSKIQIPNYMLRPMILIPPVIASIIIAPIMTTLWPMQNVAAGAGMGTSGFVGQIMTIKTMGSSLETWLQIGVFHFILPGVISYIIYVMLLRANIIKPGDQKISTGGER
ncbi:PTS transporter subunit IIC [Macrococcoides caseolyticum]|uniref:PTS transporter subunit IIC n=1 Tax=Macrococcoides caseolyticum TaxID=69966 RepID=UPI000C33BB89|nr:PTS sugar transporter subunit IIC [Macrococcus caseolyticus]MDJ1090655.1 PTS sugar transporter subunit IIC [Macrococcus caseolyticus]PKE13183.1 PTS sugar transporter subunit IIC [Macrococcus caseolyticus]PKE48320.1 PTS sugar transporter subunit IIC [Macrococcus caseolyticus]PKF15302.1 PTS sugar transporter subunit IIC [Macrococcus caseolyticus]TDM24120.1 PTS sugar transporter subunit IIC [Macrococcus caseolyticus]